MLLGEHKHTLDTKKRLSLPAKFRKELGKTVVVTRGFDSALFVYSLK
jgi:MraZ protein